MTSTSTVHAMIDSTRVPDFYAVSTDYDRNAGRKRDYLTVWAGPFASEYVAAGVSLPRGDGYMVTVRDGTKIRVTCPTPRTDENFRQVDGAISLALVHYYDNV